MDVKEEPSSDDTWTLVYFFISILSLLGGGRFSGKEIDINELG